MRCNDDHLFGESIQSADGGHLEAGAGDENVRDETSVCQTQVTQKKRKKGLLVKLKWSVRDTTKLINEVKMRPSLWNNLCPEKRDSNQREFAWAAVAASFPGKQVTAENCTAKWQSLRAVNRKIKKKKKGKSDWPHLDRMSFVPFGRGATSKSDLVNTNIFPCSLLI